MERKMVEVDEEYLKQALSYALVALRTADDIETLVAYLEVEGMAYWLANERDIDLDVRASMVTLAAEAVELDAELREASADARRQFGAPC